MGEESSSRSAKSLVVVIEDDQPIRDTFEQFLRLEGYAVKAFPNGLEALEWLKGLPEVSFILLDSMMPIMDGSEFMKEFKQLPGPVSSVPVILCSATASHTEYKDMGCAGFIKKPVNLEKLILTIGELVISS